MVRRRYRTRPEDSFHCFVTLFPVEEAQMAQAENSEQAPFSGGNFDFSFAFMCQEFSDCVLRLHIEHDDPPDKPADPPKEPENPPSGLVLPSTPSPAPRGAPGRGNHNSTTDLLETPDVEETLYNRQVKPELWSPGDCNPTPETPSLLPSTTHNHTPKRRSHTPKCTQEEERSTKRRFISPLRDRSTDRGTAGEAPRAGEGPRGEEGEASHAEKERVPLTEGEERGDGEGDVRMTGTRGECRTRVEEFPVCTVILVAKSQFFRRMFTGHFLEANKGVGPTGTKSVDLHLTAAEEQPFRDLLHFVYSGNLPASLPQNLENCLRLLLLADRFAVLDCTQACFKHLQDHACTLTPSDSLSLLSLPETVRHADGLEAVITAARRTLQQHYCPMLATPEDSRLMALPEVALPLLLDAESVGEASEDDVALFAILWAYYNSGGHAQAVALLSRSCVAHLHLQVVSPSMVKLLCSVLEGSVDIGEFKVLLMASLCTSKILSDRSSEVLLARLPRNEAARDCGTGDELQGVQEGFVPAGALAALGDALVALSEQSWVVSRSLPVGRSLSSMLTGRAIRSPRRGVEYREPSRQIFLDVPRSKCLEWREVSPIQRYLATSSFVHVQGRWMCLAASVYDAGQPTLRVSLKYDAGYSGHLSQAPKPFKVVYHMSVVTSTTMPAYQVLRRGVMEFSAQHSTARASDFFQRPWQAVLANEKHFMPSGCLQLRADVWLMDETGEPE